MKLSEVVKHKRFVDNLTLHEAAKVSGLGYMTHWKIEHGYVKLSFDTVRKLCYWLNVTPAEIRQMCEEE